MNLRHATTSLTNTATQEGGYLYSNDGTVLGLDIDEEKAAELLQDDRLQSRWAADDRRAA